MTLAFVSLGNRARGAVMLATLLVTSAAATLSAQEPPLPDSIKGPIPRDFKNTPGPTPSGIYDFKEFNFGIGITECPQARLARIFPDPLDRRVIDDVERYSEGGDDLRTNEEFSCAPQNETSIAVNPTQTRNIVAGANDYRMGTGSSGFYASTDNGRKWFSGIIPFPSIPPPADPALTNQGYLVSGGDPAIVFDRAGVAYYAQIAFSRNDDTNGVFVSRSTNGGYTWSRARVGGTDPNPRLPGDGVVVYQEDNNTVPDFSVSFHDKEYIAAGPRPAGVSPQCFTPQHTPAPCVAERVGVDRLYVSWTAFNTFLFPVCPIPGVPGPCSLIVSSTIDVSYSDDQARSWSPRRTVNGSASFCTFAFASETGCDDNQFSTPTVSPRTGHLYVAFENFNTPDENQYLVVRSRDGGATFEGPFFVTPIFDVNFPRSGVAGGRPDCTPRGQQNGRQVYTNSCFRSNPAGNIVVDKRRGAFADDLYLVMSDNRNGTRVSSNSDIFLFKSTDGGLSWIGPTRVNNDRSSMPAVRDCGRTGMTPCPAAVNTGNDQWWPWADINEKGHLNVVFSDRRLDEDSIAHEYPASRQRPGNYLVWFWGAQCTVHRADSRECLAPGAALIPQPTAPINPGTPPVPGQGPTFVGGFRNFGISDTTSNWDYSFSGGIFAGDYNGVAVAPGRGETKAFGFWTDARNGRSSRTQLGRNPPCEQSDVMVQGYGSERGSAHDDRKHDDDEGGHEGGRHSGQNQSRPQDALFLVTPCPTDGGGGHR
jgi:hypothetical protein